MSTTLLDPGLTGLGFLQSYAGGSDEAATSNIFVAEGTPLSRKIRRKKTREYRNRMTRFTRIYQGTLEGDRRAQIAFEEAMSRPDFPLLFGDIIDRQLLAAYQTQKVQWPAYARKGSVRDFRTVRRYTLDGGEAVLNKVKELAPYKARKVSDGKYEYAVEKYGDILPISWESIVNDDLGALASLPLRLGTAARRTEERFAAALFSDAAGPNAAFFAEANKNVITTNVIGSGQAVTPNPPLTIDAVQLAFQVLAQQKDKDGGPIYIEGVSLVVPPALAVPARNIVGATEITAAAGGGPGDGNNQLRVSNWMQNQLTVVVNPWLPIINTTSGNTAWYLFADPNVGRPAMEIGFLKGHETPELWVKASNAIRVGGGPVDPEEGDFEHDATQYRVRTVIGGTLMDPKSAVASKGTGQA